MTQQADNAQDQSLSKMIQHHQTAIEMANVALHRAEHAEITQFAQKTIADQQREIEQMTRLRGDHATTGSGSMAQSGMNEAEMLKSATPFDKSFLDAMMQHHEAAITMATSMQRVATSGEVADLAATMIAAQQREIGQMRAWRSEWYGS